MNVAQNMEESDDDLHCIFYLLQQVKNWTQDLIDIEHKAKESARVLFFVLDAETRAAAAAIEVAHLAASIQSRHLVLVLQPYRRGQQIAGESVPDQSVSYHQHVSYIECIQLLIIFVLFSESIWICLEVKQYFKR